MVRLAANPRYERASAFVGSVPTVDFAIDLSKFFTIPTFGLPELELSFYFAVGLLGFSLVQEYGQSALHWLAAQPWFAMPTATPGYIERLPLKVFGWVRCVSAGGVWRARCTCVRVGWSGRMGLVAGVEGETTSTCAFQS